MAPPRFSGLPQTIFKWDENANGGAPGFLSGNKTFQVLQGDQSVVSATYFSFNGQHYLGMASFLDGGGHTVQTASTVYMYDARLQGNYSACGLPCSGYRGQFKILQHIPTTGARAMHYFQVRTTGSVRRFLAVAQMRDDEGNSVDSDIYLFSGGKFHLFQRIPTQFASALDSYEAGDQTFLVVGNRGCPIASDIDPGPSSCPTETTGGTTLFFFDKFSGQFVQVRGKEDAATLLRPDPDYAAAPLVEGVTAFQLSKSSLVNVVVGVSQFIVSANGGLLAEAEAGPRCFAKQIPGFEITYRDDCWHPADLWEVVNTAQPGVQTLLDGAVEKLPEIQLSLDGLQNSLDGGINLIGRMKGEPSLEQVLYGASSAVTFSNAGQTVR